MPILTPVYNYFELDLTEGVWRIEEKKFEFAIEKPYCEQAKSEKRLENSENFFFFFNKIMEFSGWKI